MNVMLRWVLCGLLPVVPIVAMAQQDGIRVENAWSRVAMQGGTGVVYLTITDSGAPDRLMSIAAPVAAKAELHESFTEHGVAKMRGGRHSAGGAGHAGDARAWRPPHHADGSETAVEGGRQFPRHTEFRTFGSDHRDGDGATHGRWGVGRSRWDARHDHARQDAIGLVVSDSSDRARPSPCRRPNLCRHPSLCPNPIRRQSRG